MKHRPRIIIIFAVGYLLTSVGFIAKACYYWIFITHNHAPWNLLLNSPLVLISALGEPLLQIVSDPSLLIIRVILPIIVAYGIYSCKLWGWYLAVGHVSFILTTNIYFLIVAYEEPRYLPIWVRLLGYVLTLFLLFVLLRKEIRTPYFNPRIRW